MKFLFLHIAYFITIVLAEQASTGLDIAEQNSTDVNDTINGTITMEHKGSSDSLGETEEEVEEEEYIKDFDVAQGLENTEDKFNEELIQLADRIKPNRNEEDHIPDPNKLEWEEKVNSFEPAEIISFFIDGSDQEMLFDVIHEVPSHITIVFFVNEETPIDLEIRNPNQELILTHNDQTHMFYEFNATIAGEYVYRLYNIKYRRKRITFAIHQGNNTDTHLSHKNIETLWQKIYSIKKVAKSLRFNARLISQKYDIHYDQIKKHNRNIVMFSLIETGAMTLIFFFQLLYIKKLAHRI